MDEERSCDSPVEVDLRQALEQAGWRYTRQRAEVFSYLRSVDCHPTAEQVFAAVRQSIPNISLATVYKALEALVDAGLAACLADEVGGPVRYDRRPQPHYHLRCELTGQVRDLPLPYDATLLERLAPELLEDLRRQGFEVLGHRLEVIGRFRPAEADQDGPRCG
jgi:Fur family peroxide stress response transcriptional regulator